jgi:ABC-2 type transport system permease protein
MRPRLPHIVKKEFIQIRRDRRMAPLILMAPVIQLLLLGYAATTDVRNIRTAVLDGDRTADSRYFAERIGRADNFQMVSPPGSPREMVRLLDRGEIRAGLVVQRGFAKKLGRGEKAPVQLLLDGTDAVTAGVVMGYLQRIAAQVNERSLEREGRVYKMPASIETRVWYNPTLESRNFFIPGIICLLLLVLTTIMPSLAIVKEREQGTLEQLIVTPIRPVELILGKLIPFAIIGFVEITVIITFGWILFDVVPRGSIGLLFALSGVFLLNTLGLGLLVSTVSRNQQQVLMTIFSFLFPSIILSGFVFPIASMPEWIQVITYAVPLRYFLEIVRGIYLRGVGMEILWPQAAALLGMGLFFIVTAVFRFKKRL